ncbi:MAG: hypothetical protein QOC81_1029 [Thermoanaerobaculia bacterium]|jgi:hypothetical protein|nr:hypothetical protein [Thermoanaerobaculia bacterium]
MKTLRDWWRLKGKIAAYQIILLFLVLGSLFKNVPAIKALLPDDRIAILFLAAALFLLLQIIMALLGDKVDDVRIVTLNPTAPDFIKSVIKAKNLDVAFSSTETLFPFIQEALLTATIDCRVLLRNPEAGNERMKHKLLDYEERWKALSETNPNCKVAVKYCNNTVFRLVILNKTEVYFGFHKAAGRRLLGYNIPMLHVEPGTVLGDYFVMVATNRFEASWAEGTDVISERPSLV